MKRTRYRPEQIAFAPRQSEGGTPVVEICPKMGIAEQTLYAWKKRLVHMGVAEVRQLKPLEQENRRLKRLVVDLSPDTQVLQDVLRKIPMVPRACADTRSRRLPRDNQLAVRGTEITGITRLARDNLLLIQRFC